MSTCGHRVRFSGLPEMKTEPRYKYGVEQKLKDARATQLQLLKKEQRQDKCNFVTCSVFCEQTFFKCLQLHL